MKRLLLASVLALMALSAAPVGAQIQVCIEWDSFCDNFQLEVDASGNVYGWWDWDCDGFDDSDDTPLLGDFGNGRMTLAGDGGDLATWSHRWDLPAGHYDLWVWDGITPPEQVCDDETYTVVLGPCPVPGSDLRKRPNRRSRRK